MCEGTWLRSILTTAYPYSPRQSRSSVQGVPTYPEHVPDWHVPAVVITEGRAEPRVSLSGALPSSDGRKVCDCLTIVAVSCRLALRPGVPAVTVLRIDRICCRWKWCEAGQSQCDLHEETRRQLAKNSPAGHRVNPPATHSESSEMGLPSFEYCTQSADVEQG